MKKSVYQENVEKSIKRNMRLAGIDNKASRDMFLRKIIYFCSNMKDKPFKFSQISKTSKTRHG